MRLVDYQHLAVAGPGPLLCRIGPVDQAILVDHARRRNLKRGGVLAFRWN